MRHEAFALHSLLFTLLSRAICLFSLSLARPHHDCCSHAAPSPHACSHTYVQARSVGCSVARAKRAPTRVKVRIRARRCKRRLFSPAMRCVERCCSCVGSHRSRRSPFAALFISPPSLSCRLVRVPPGAAVVGRLPHARPGRAHELFCLRAGTAECVCLGVPGCC